MQIDLTPEQDDVVRLAIASGRIARPEDAVAQALDDWVERERQRLELVASLDEAEAQIERGEGIVLDDDDALSAFFAELEAGFRDAAKAKRA